MHGSLTLDLAAMLFPPIPPHHCRPSVQSCAVFLQDKARQIVRMYVCSLCYIMSAFIKLREAKRFALADSASHPLPPPPLSHKLFPCLLGPPPPDTKQCSRLRKEMGIGSIDSRHCRSQSHPRKAKAATLLLRQEHRSAAVSRRPNLAEATSFARHCC